MTFKKMFLLGAFVGAVLTIVLWPGAPYNGFLFNSMTTPLGITIAAWLCPFDVMIFFTRSMLVAVAVAIIGNAIWYGLLAMLCLLFYRFIRWIGRGKLRVRLD